MRKSRNLRKFQRDNYQAEIKPSDKSVLSKSEQSKMRQRKSRKLRKLQKENYQAKSKIKPSDTSGQLPIKREKIAKQNKIKCKAKKLKTVKQLPDLVSSVLDAVKDAFPKEASNTAETREVKCDQCGELFDSIQTLNVHKF